MNPDHNQDAAAPSSPPSVGPLSHLRVLDIGHALAAPFSASLLSDFGAEVIKIERPQVGDSLRGLGPKLNGESLWWKAASRNKYSLTLDFQTPAGRDTLLQLVDESDILIENFIPGTLERHGLGWHDLHGRNERLIMLRISGFGQTGPMAANPGFGRLADAMSGISYLTGDPDGPPLSVGFSLADTVSGVFGAFGIMVALTARERTGQGDCIDLALFESLFRLVDWQVIVHDQLGVVPKRSGNKFPEVLSGVASDTVMSSDGKWLTYSAATDAVLSRLIGLAFGPDALSLDIFSTATSRAENRKAVEPRVRDLIRSETASALLRQFSEHAVPLSPVLSIADISENEQYASREDIISVHDDALGSVKMHGVVPKLLKNAGYVSRTGPALGEHTTELLQRVLGLSLGDIERLHEQKAI